MRLSLDSFLSIFCLLFLKFDDSRGCRRTAAAFVVVPASSRVRTTTGSVVAVFSSPSPQQEEAAKLLERARAMRAEIASLEGRSIDEVEAEAQQKKDRQRKLDQEQKERSQRQRTEMASERKVDGSFLNVPETFEDQITQAKFAIERAFRDGITRQTVRFALIPEGQVLNQDRQWPGGAQQMYREAAGPLTRELLRQLKVVTSKAKDDADNNNNDLSAFQGPLNVKSQDIWDFDGSALITAESSLGPCGDVQALVQPNTDTKYIKDIDKISQALGKDRLFLLVNPFWRNVDSWGFNILAPNAKKLAQQVIFDNNGYEETYVLLQKSARGEDCIALKAYPYDWQLYAYADSSEWYPNYNNNQSYLIRLGTTKHEPTSSDFSNLLQRREEFKLSKNMRQMQRLLNKDE